MHVVVVVVVVILICLMNFLHALHKKCFKFVLKYVYCFMK